MNRREFLQKTMGVLVVTGLPFKLALSTEVQSEVRWQGCNDPAFSNPDSIAVEETDGIVVIVPPLRHRYVRFVCDMPDADPQYSVYCTPVRQGRIWDGGYRMTKRDLLHIDDRLLVT